MKTYTKKEVKKLLHEQVIACAHKFGKQPQTATDHEIFEAIKKTDLIELSDDGVVFTMTANLTGAHSFSAPPATVKYFIDGIEVSENEFNKATNKS